jgi:hypothetical protein
MAKKLFVELTILAILAAGTAFALSNPQNASAQAAAPSQTIAQAPEVLNGPGGRGWGSSQPAVSGASSQAYGQGLGLLPAAGQLSQVEADGLLFMYEEEKLAHDVYFTLYNQWNSPVFQNIASSELTHMQAIQTLLVRYALQVPASSQVGVFANPELQALYTQLVSRGGQSLNEALKVGGAIEELDILDLQERLQQTDNADIQRVYTSLLNGSSNHLRAFAAALVNQTGETYIPQYLTESEYQTILNGASQGGPGGRGQGRGMQASRP